MAGDFRFSYLLIKYRKVSGSDDTRNAVVRKLAQGFESLSLRQQNGQAFSLVRFVFRYLIKGILHVALRTIRASVITVYSIGLIDFSIKSISSWVRLYFL